MLVRHVEQNLTFKLTRFEGEIKEKVRERGFVKQNVSITKGGDLQQMVMSEKQMPATGSGCKLSPGFPEATWHGLAQDKRSRQEVSTAINQPGICGH